jgi:hypothetical protein
MGNTLRYASVVWFLGAGFTLWSAGCFSDNSPAATNVGHPDAGSGVDSSVNTMPDSSTSGGDASGNADAEAGIVYTLIDDMEHGTHGPIELEAGITPPDTPAYWFNFGASKPADAGPPLDTADPAIQSFTFSDVTPPTTTLNGKTSTRAAHQSCVLNKLYDVCGIGVEFAQVPDAGDGGDAGDAGAAIVDAGADAEASIPEHTITFDISAYKGITFWGRSGDAPDGGGDAGDDAGGFDVKVLFPDTDTDPRGGVCNGPNSGASGPDDTSQCFNSYAFHVSFTSEWKQYTVMFSDLLIDTTFGYQAPAPWSGTNVYGINWQAQDNADDASDQPMDLWIDDVYFIQ